MSTAHGLAVVIPINWGGKKGERDSFTDWSFKSGNSCRTKINKITARNTLNILLIVQLTSSTRTFTNYFQFCFFKCLEIETPNWNVLTWKVKQNILSVSELKEFFPHFQFLLWLYCASSFQILILEKNYGTMQLSVGSIPRQFTCFLQITLRISSISTDKTFNS